MVAEATRTEFETRFACLEREVEGEKIVTRHILEQTRHNSDDLAAIKTRLERVESKVDNLETKLDGLVRDLPNILTEAMRDVMSQKRRPKKP